MLNRNLYGVVALLVMVVFFFSGCSGKHVRSEPEKDFIFYPPLPNQPKFQYLTSFSTSDDVKKKSSLFKFVAGKKELKPQPIKKPYGIDVFDGVMYVCDLRSNAIIVIDLNRQSFGYLGVTGSGKLKKPANLFIDKEDRHIYVTDTRRNQILVYTLDGKLIKAFGKKGEYIPLDVELYKGKIYITDLKSHQVLVLNKESGEIENRIGAKGHREDELYHPTNLDIHEDRIYITDTTNFRISIFDIHGKHRGSFGSVGKRPGNFTRPKGIAVDREGRIYVVDSAFENIQVFNQDQKLLLFMLGPGKEPDNINLPAAVHIDYDNIQYFKKYIAPGFKVKYLVFITSNFGLNKVNVYAYGKYRTDK